MRRSMILSSLILAALLASCNQPTVAPVEPTKTIEQVKSTEAVPKSTLEPTATTTPTKTPIPAVIATQAPSAVGPDQYPADVNPLTGLKVADPALLDRRPIAVKVNIVPRYSTRPPWGLSFADIVFDYYHNAGYTRLFAIFYGSDAELVGPVRSGRLLDVELVRMYQSIFAYGSADATINDRLLNSEFSNRLVLEGDPINCPPSTNDPLCRFEPTGVDLLLGNTQALSQHISSQGVANGRQDLKGMYFNETPASGGTALQQVYVRYSGDNYLRWDYDPTTGQYLRFQDNAYDQGGGEDYTPLTDRLNDQQIAADNVIIIAARHEYFRQPPGEIVDILLSGVGDGYAIRDGQIYQITWERPNINSVLTLRLPDGTSYPFKPGKTWIQVVGTSTVSTQPGEGVWRFDFRIP